MNKAGKGVVALIVVAGVIAGGVMGVEWWQVGRFMQETDNAYVRTDSVAVLSPSLGYKLGLVNYPLKCADSK